MKLFYRKYGTGTTLIILHGLFGSSDNWVSIAKSLKREQDNSFSWKINAPAIFKNLDRIIEGIETGDTGGGITGFPVYFIKGENSAYLPESDFTEIRKVFPGAEFIVIPGAGHWIHADNPEMVRKCFLRLLDNY